MNAFKTTRVIASAGLLGYSSILLSGDIGVEGSVTAATFVGDGSELTGVVTTEVDPQVGSVDTSKWCVGDGAAVQCNKNAPVTNEVDPVVDGLSADKWCKADATASVINCDQDAPQIPEGVSSGDMQYWDGAAWVLVPAAPVDRKYALISENGVPNWAPTPYFIGDIGPAGGIVFYTTDDGLHGMEAALADIDIAGVPWGCPVTDVPGADGTATGTGAQNTADIVAVDCSLGQTAARIADAYRQNGYGDWFLPSKDELKLLYEKRTTVPQFYFDAYYWSSTEANTSTAWDQYFHTGDQDQNSKTLTRKVRPIREF